MAIEVQKVIISIVKYTIVITKPRIIKTIDQ